MFVPIIKAPAQNMDFIIIPYIRGQKGFVNLCLEVLALNDTTASCDGAVAILPPCGHKWHNLFLHHYHEV